MPKKQFPPDDLQLLDHAIRRLLTQFAAAEARARGDDAPLPRDWIDGDEALISEIHEFIDQLDASLNERKE